MIPPPKNFQLPFACLAMVDSLEELTTYTAHSRTNERPETTTLICLSVIQITRLNSQQ